MAISAYRSSALRRLRNFYPAFGWVTQRFIWALVIIALLVALAAVLPGVLDVAIVASIAVIVLLIVDVILGPSKSQFEVSREPAAHLALRSPARLGYDIINRGRADVRYSIVDTPLDALDFTAESADGFLAGRHRKNDSLPVMPRIRGPAQLGTLFVSVQNSVGFLSRRWKLQSDQQVRVYPDLSAVERYGELAKRGRLTEAGFRKLRLRGRGGEFDSLREWTPDDEFRSINWKASARRAKLMAAQYDIERSQTVMLVLDAGRLMTPRLGDQRKFDYAVTAALSVAYIASLADDKVGLMAFAGDILEHIPPRSGAQHASGMTQRIYDLQPRFEEADYSRAFAYLRRRQPKRSLVIFFTDMFDPVACAAALANMAQLVPRHLALCVLMNDEAVQSALATAPKTPEEAYKASVAASLLQERRKAAAILSQRGIIVIDVPAKALTVSLINAYIEVKARSLL